VQIPYGLLPPFSEAQAPQPRPNPSHRGNLLVLDWTNRLQVFSPKGKRLCTRNDFGRTEHRLEWLWQAAGSEWQWGSGAALASPASTGRTLFPLCGGELIPDHSLCLGSSAGVLLSCARQRVAMGAVGIRRCSGDALAGEPRLDFWEKRISISLPLWVTRQNQLRSEQEHLTAGARTTLIWILRQRLPD
jgi:hypothetical protein